MGLTIADGRTGSTAHEEESSKLSRTFSGCEVHRLWPFAGQRRLYDRLDNKAKLQADKDWATAIANAEKYQELQRLMLQGLPSAAAPPAAVSQPPQALLTPEEKRRQEIVQREKVCSDEWRLLEHDVAKRVLQRDL